MGKVWVKSFDCANEMSWPWLGTGVVDGIEVLQRSGIRLGVSDKLLALDLTQQHSASQQDNTEASADVPL